MSRSYRFKVWCRFAERVKHPALGSRQTTVVRGIILAVNTRKGLTHARRKVTDLADQTLNPEEVLGATLLSTH